MTLQALGKEVVPAEPDFDILGRLRLLLHVLLHRLVEVHVLAVSGGVRLVLKDLRELLQYRLTRERDVLMCQNAGA